MFVPFKNKLNRTEEKLSFEGKKVTKRASLNLFIPTEVYTLHHS